MSPGVTGTIHRNHRFRYGTALHRIGISPVRNKQRDIDSGLPETLIQMLQISGVISDDAVFIFNLHQNHRPALGPLKPLQPGQQNIEITVDGVQVLWIAATYPQSGLAQQPGRQSAEIPFRADIRAGTQDHHQPHRSGKAYKTFQIAPAGKIELAFLLLMKVPRDVRFDGIQAALFQFPEPVFPVVGVNSEIVHGSGTETHLLPVHKNLFPLNANTAHAQISFYISIHNTVFSRLIIP